MLVYWYPIVSDSVTISVSFVANVIFLSGFVPVGVNSAVYPAACVITSMTVFSTAPTVFLCGSVPAFNCPVIGTEYSQNSVLGITTTVIDPW
ncbi:hypothetical protein EUBVEN_00428 [Eubacterium ventriosum ATCC 27560]|uniref:Uncharacterized protein n=1 Tax=Eubacterium ventriosum ATCC 27560 TaxID=411463 RepID=A5Z423_9FIRM|nr:hypothetical protein EUBVEN_00428 [Eubacterium ventriosum ATCC 27560]